MHVILQVRSGSIAGKTIVLQPGQKALVGRASWADLHVPDDVGMSGRHFTLECNHDRCILRNYKGSHGTLLNGGQVREAVLKHGDQVVAGQTAFRVSITDGPVVLEEPSAPEPALVPSPPPAPDLRSILLDDGQPLFALLDAARDPNVLQLLHSSGGEFESLYEGEKGQELAAFGPYLAALPRGAALLAPLLEHGWGESWGVFVTSPAPFADVRKHFRRFLLVTLDSGEEVYFRFYDPRVLRVFLPTCTADEARQFFGPVDAFLVENNDPDELLRFRVGGALGPRCETLAVTVPGAISETSSS